jgi:hypothetical protein
MVTYFQDTIFSTSELTATGLGTLVDVAVNNFFSTSNYTMIVSVANHGGNVTVRLDGSIDGTNFAPIIGAQTISSSDPVVFSVSGRPVKQIRPNVTAIAAGSPTITINVAAN